MQASHSAWAVALGGLATLALVMGIGRFAFTPVLPMMQADWGITVAQGGWLACANYAGYLLGGLAAMCSPMRSRAAIRSGVLAIVLATAAMALEQGFAGWLTLRALAGFASAWVMVHASAWLLERLTQAHREDLSGVVYAGVGAGIVLAGLVCVALAALEQDSRTAWIALALVALAIVACTWPVAGDAKPLQASAGRVRNGARACPHFRHLVLCYGAFGLGYIIPATFLPVMAKELVAAPGLFEWAWPVFGAAAALSTLAAARLRRAMTGRTLWIGGNLVMAAGVLVPLVLPNLIGIVLAALCVGGTFMVVTMAGLQEARSVAGSNARALMGAMTACFGLGQIAGPLLVSSLASLPNGFAWALVASAAPLLAASYSLHRQRARPLVAQSG